MYKDIKEALQGKYVVNVEFIKKNGDTRKMKCTTNLDLIPESKHPKGESSVFSNEEVFRVYDVVNEGWRSFRTDSVVVHDVIKPKKDT